MLDAISVRALTAKQFYYLLVILFVAGFMLGFASTVRAQELSPVVQTETGLTIDTLLDPAVPKTIEDILDALPKALDFNPPIIKAPLDTKARLKLPAPVPSDDWKRRYGPTIIEVARINNVPPNLIMAVIAVESGFNHKAQNGTSAGLMQIKLATARGYGLSAGNGMQSLHDPYTNIRVASNYLGAAYKIARGDTCRAVSRYNQGLGSGRINADYCAKVARIMRYAEYWIVD